MPVAVSYPGVYVEEIPSGVRTITGVATSITVFVGWAKKGPTDRAELVLSWTDYERKFGGLDSRSYLGYSVYHFFNNGGTKAYIMRLAAADSVAAKVTLGDLKIAANSPGEWANDYAIVTKKQAGSERFRLVVANNTIDKKGISVEVFENLSMSKGDSRYVKTVLKNDSNLVNAEATDENDTTAPSDTVIPANEEIPADAELKDGANGTVLSPGDAAFITSLGDVANKEGLLDRIDLFNILCVPGLEDTTAIGGLQDFCRTRRAFLIVDCKKGDDFGAVDGGPSGNITADDSINSAFYFPWVLAPDALQENRPKEFPPCGFVAGIYARTDAARGVWKAPAGTEASLTGIIGLDATKNLTDSENGVLNPLAVNCIRTFPVYGTIVWGARTLQGNDERGSEWKYVPVRRTALFIEETLYRALKWVVFEPNDEPLWAQIRLNVGAFMHNMFRQGAFQGVNRKDAYFVKCDNETTTQNDVNLGIVNIVVGFAPLKPAEFVIIKLQQMAGQIEV